MAAAEDSRTWTMSLRSGGSSLYSYSFAQSIYSSEFAVPVNSVKHVLRFFFSPDLYLKRGRLTQILYLSTIVATAMLIVYIQLGMMADATTKAEMDQSRVAHEVQRIQTTQIMTSILSKERYAVIQYLLATNSRMAAQLDQVWQSIIDSSYQTVSSLAMWPIPTSPEFIEFTQNSRLYTVELDGHRSNVKRKVNTTTVEFKYYSSLMIQFLNAIPYAMRNFNVGGYWPEAAAYFLLSRSRYEVDRVRTTVTAGIYKDRTDIFGAQRVYGEMLQITEQAPKLGRDYLAMTLRYADAIKPVESSTNPECSICKLQDRTFDRSFGLLAENYEIVNQSYYDWEAKALPILNSFAADLSRFSMTDTDQENLIIIDIIIAIFSTVACTLVTYAIYKLNQKFLEIRDRTDQLRGKTEEADSLLYQMLPVAVAKMLKEGGTIAPEFFEEATVYFNDVYGFHEFVSVSEPLKIVALLNNLYQSLDERIELYGCYKVETVSDTYMVVGGVPKRRSDHAAAIAMMALDMIETAKQIPMGDGYVRIRVGLNSGPVFAGVVGLVMPRYCLFGDTVNTASRMESSSKPLHVHCSEKTCTLLRRHGGFNLEYRGKVHVKGKGEMKTYWLRGYEPITALTASFGLEKSTEDSEALDDGIGFSDL